VIGASVETQLDDTLTKLLLGEIELHDLCSPLAGFYVAGHAAGMKASPERHRLEWEADMWAWCYFNKKSPEHFYRHLTTELWNEAVR